MKTDTLSGYMLEYAVSMAVGHQARRPELLAQQGFAAWQEFEQARGNPIPAYTHHFKLSMPLLDAAGICTVTQGFGWSAFVGGGLDDVLHTFGNTRVEAGLRCLVKIKFGDDVSLPGVSP